MRTSRTTTRLTLGARIYTEERSSLMPVSSSLCSQMLRVKSVLAKTRNTRKRRSITNTRVTKKVESTTDTLKTVMAMAMVVMIAMTLMTRLRNTGRKNTNIKSITRDLTEEMTQVLKDRVQGLVLTQALQDLAIREQMDFLVKQIQGSVWAQTS